MHDHVTNVLLIDGTGMAGDWMSDKLLLQNDTGMFGQPDPEERRALEAAWHDMQYERVGLDCGNRADKIELCQRAISSGHFHAVVMSDLSEDSVALPAVRAGLGPLLQAFVRGGGALAITSCESPAMLGMLRALFDVT